MGIVRKAELKDTDDLIKLNLQIQDMHAREYPKIFKSEVNRSELRNFIEYIINSESHYIFVYASESVVKGYCWAEHKISKESLFTHQINKVFIQHIGVEENSRGMGIGKRLLGAVEALSDSLNCDHIALDVWSFNVQAVKFFEQYGFKGYNNFMWLKANRVKASI